MNSTLRAALLAVPLLLASLGTPGCVDPKGGQTGNTPLYVYDNLAKRVLVWNDINTLYNLGAGATAPQPDRIISGTLISSLGNLAWGGMVMNPLRNELFLVDENGNVVRIEKAEKQNGSLTSPLDIASFTLGSISTDRLASSVFGQAAIDPSLNTLFVCENGSSSATRLWVVTSPEQIASGSQAPPAFVTSSISSTDYTGTGVAAAGSGNAFAFYTGGTVLTSITGDQFSGPRLRLSSGGSYPVLGNVLVGEDTTFWDGSTTPAWGTLAYDGTMSKLYLARPYTSQGNQNAVVVFYPSQFSNGSMDQAPNAVLPDTTGALPNLRVISHARTKDWLVGIDQDASASPTNADLTLTTLHLWKQPSQKGASIAVTLAPVTVNNTPTNVGIRAVAMDGSL